MAQNVYDVAIIGGGPAGSTAASILAREGFSVILFEKERFPRRHVGSSLLPFCYDLFIELGLLDLMERKYPRKPGACFANYDASVETTYCFKHVVENPKHLSFHVRRDEFDHDLLKNAQSLGATVFEETEVQKVDHLDSDQPIEITTRRNEKTTVYSANYLLDASGRSTLLAKKMKSRKPMEGLDRTAFHTFWKTDNMPPELLTGMARINYLEGDKKGWIWTFPVGLEQMDIGVVVDNAYLRQQKPILKEKHGDKWKEAFYMQEIACSPKVESFIEDAELLYDITVEGNYSYISDKKYGDNWVMIGDAGQFIDPIFSSGVFIAMKSSQIVAKTLAEQWKAKEEVHLEEAFQTIKNGYDTVGELINIYYNPTILNFAHFGTQEELKSDQFEDFRSAYSLIHYLLAGDFFEKGHIYLKFFQDLREKKKFDRWQNLVKWDQEKSGVFFVPLENCGESEETLFGTIEETSSTV